MSAEGDLLKELSFQLIVTRAMLQSVEPDQILYIILSGITHGDGLNFNRAVLFLSWDRRNELRVSRSAGPASGVDAHRIWEEIVAEKLDLQSLLDRYSSSERGGELQYLTRHLSDFSFKPEDAQVQNFDGRSHVELWEVMSHSIAMRSHFFSNDLVIEYRSPDAGEVLRFEKFACVPIFLQDEVFGVMLVDNAFNHRNIELSEMRGLSTVGNLASIALERASLYRRLTEMVKIDGLTGVFNRSYYERTLHDEYLRSKRLGRSLSMIIFDIDHFKQYNDSYGHSCGDKVLQGFAQLLKSRVRDEDMVARYGGEEFVVLLSGGPCIREAEKLAEKLRKLIESSQFAGFAAGRITASADVGIIEPSERLEQLFLRADQALYRAKADGRNCVRVYEASPSNDVAE